MTAKEAIDILRNAAWLGSNEDRDRTEEAVNMAIEALKVQNAVMHIDLPEISKDDVVKMIKTATNQFLILSDGKDTKVPSNDCISRRAAKLKVARVIWEDGDSCYDFHDKCVDCLDNLPSAQPHWIPCSERLPEDDALMLVNYIDNRSDAMGIWIGWHEMGNVWYIDGEVHSKECGNEVIAWMPLPEPYQGGADT